MNRKCTQHEDPVKEGSAHGASHDSVLRMDQGDPRSGRLKPEAMVAVNRSHKTNQVSMRL
jgi:hypothetical protein